MVNPRVSSRRSKSAVERDRYTAELSTGQLVIGVCILLMFGLGCFLLGVLIGKFDPTLRDETLAGLPDAAGGPDARAVAPPPSTAERPPVRPADNGLRPEDRPPPNMVEPSAPKPQDAAADATGSGAAAVPPASSTVEDLPDAGAVTPSASAGDRVVVVTPPAPLPEPAKSAETKPADAAPAEIKPEPPKANPPKTDPPKPTVVASKSPKLQYGVQIIAVARPRAEGVKRDIEARSPYKATIIPIDGDRLCKVVVGRFDDKAGAERTRDELKSKYTFRDAFVIVLE